MGNARSNSNFLMGILVGIGLGYVLNSDKHRAELKAKFNKAQKFVLDNFEFPDTSEEKKIKNQPSKKKTPINKIFKGL